MRKTPARGTNFGCYDLETWHAVVARSTFVSQNATKLRGSGYFSSSRCTCQLAK